ncbi:hypothetical protein [Fuerstiella marisgermanici]|uniref:Uncharacterized protein n=1 Tax=Fuerstiella marisgermanici TaxID=1891926 RepID=A0A1P8WQU1_9PLAN|nr:hypothetical protein [Fuerstiella marisgermanici]APZ96398.1 hypothetical protein Fuma_06067 [Fuerstiella marisgermanici]
MTNGCSLAEGVKVPSKLTEKEDDFNFGANDHQIPPMLPSWQVIPPQLPVQQNASNRQ